MQELFVYNRGKKLKCGYTTGSCAAAASKAAAHMLHHQSPLRSVSIQTPAGVVLTLDVRNPTFDGEQAACSVVKDAGDDHDATDGMAIRARVRKRSDSSVVICGGEGIGTITRAGFWGEVGESAINPVPRRMIRNEVSEVADCGWDIEISASGGREIAKNTLNDKLGIAGGISIIGTTGIVEPMSLEAMKRTICLEIDAVADAKHREILLFLGNYGRKVAESLELTAPAVKISNFIGDAVLYCKNRKFRKTTLIGHIGKLSKLSIGAFYTHSSICDLRIEAFVYHLGLAGAPLTLMRRLAACSDSEEALDTMQREGFGHVLDDIRRGCIDRIRRYVRDPQFHIEVVIYSLLKGILE